MASQEGSGRLTTLRSQGVDVCEYLNGIVAVAKAAVPMVVQLMFGESDKAAAVQKWSEEKYNLVQERVAGLKKREDGSFEELMLIREPKDLEDFRTALGLADSAEITEFY